MARESSENTKRKFISEAYNMIQECGIENITVRDLAKRVGVSSAALYRHFADLEYVLVLASIRFLDGYVKEIKDITLNGKNPVEVDIEAWKCFNKYVFQNPPLFLNLFWGKYSKELDYALQEYFELYPLEAAFRAVAMLCCPLFVGNIEERDFMWMRRAAAEGLINYDDAAYISKIDCFIAKSLLMEHIQDYREPGVAERTAEECSALIEKTIRDRVISKK